MSSSKAATFVAFRSIVKRNLTTITPTRSFPQNRLPRSYPECRIDAITSTATTRTLFRNNFVTKRSINQNSNTQNLEQAWAKSGKRNSARKAASNNSLRKVAVEAQRSRRDLSIPGNGKRRTGDLNTDTKDVTAYCAAETYNLSRARWDLHDQGFIADPCGTGLFPQVLHVQTPNFIVKDEETGQDKAQGAGDIFVFPSGCVVTWNTPERLAHTIVERFLAPSAGETGHMDRMEIEDLEYIEDPHKDSSRIVGDTIILGTKVSAENHTPEASNNSSSSSPLAENPEVDTILAKIAFSSALARSTKLAVLENRLSHYFSTTRSIPTTLSSGQTLRFTRSQILRKTGELLSIRAQLNLYSELTDSLPDLFWDSPHELGLEGYYDMVGRALDVGVRIKVLNEKMDYASEIAAVLRERLSEKHSTGLEWMIIGLICIEVVFGIIHLWREGDERRTRELLEVWLEREVRKGNAAT